jgi:MFS transporter, DHA2 family, multidrug resistance protein
MFDYQKLSAFEQPRIAQFLNPFTAAGRAALEAMVTRQAQIIAYIDDYKLLMIATLAVIPLLIVFKKSSDRGGTTPLSNY